MSRSALRAHIGHALDYLSRMNRNQKGCSIAA
jgi:hypothetical protein